mmetsp:Transcript_38584/g.81884  ORF Transcript_38584/g.81884 Transcript_38584/m.81884 type:complete len:125 (+) Transcript_38584:443-817(+)
MPGRRLWERQGGFRHDKRRWYVGQGPLVEQFEVILLLEVVFILLGTVCLAGGSLYGEIASANVSLRPDHETLSSSQGGGGGGRALHRPHPVEPAKKTKQQQQQPKKQTLQARPRQRWREVFGHP